MPKIDTCEAPQWSVAQKTLHCPQPVSDIPVFYFVFVTFFFRIPADKNIPHEVHPAVVLELLIESHDLPLRGGRWRYWGRSCEKTESSTLILSTWILQHEWKFKCVLVGTSLVFSHLEGSIKIGVWFAQLCILLLWISVNALTLYETQSAQLHCSWLSALNFLWWIGEKRQVLSKGNKSSNKMRHFFIRPHGGDRVQLWR